MIKGLIGAGYQFKQPGPGTCVIISVKDSDKQEATDLAWKLHDYGYKIYGTAEHRPVPEQPDDPLQRRPPDERRAPQRHRPAGEPAWWIISSPPAPTAATRTGIQRQVPPQGHRAVHPLHHGAGYRPRAGGRAARRPRCEHASSWWTSARCIAKNPERAAKYDSFSCLITLFKI